MDRLPLEISQSLKTKMRYVTMILNDSAAVSYCSSRNTTNRMIDNQEDYCANHCDQEAIEIQARHVSRAEGVEKPAPDDRTSNSQHDIEENSFSCLVDDLAANETCHQTQHDPGQG
jgi:hypothetical protein